LGTPIALLEYAEIKTVANSTFAKTLENFNNGGVIKGNFKGQDIFMLPIGSMKMNSIMSEIQTWKILLSPLTTYQQLLDINKKGLKIQLMTKSIYHSDYNSLHFVKYDYQQIAKYKHIGFRNELFYKRNDAWITNPNYIQKFQTTDTIYDQIITNGLSDVQLRMYNCEDASLVNTFQYIPVTPAPITLPDIVQQCIIDFSLFVENEYFFVITTSSDSGISYSLAGNPAFISEFTISGTPIEGSVVELEYQISSLSIPVTASTVVLSGWGISDIINELFAQVQSNPVFTVINILTGGDGIYMEIDPAETVLTVFKSYFTNYGAISEKIDLRKEHLKTVLIESENSINKTGAFFEQNFKSVIRVEGLMSKLQPSINSNQSKDEVGNTDLLYSQMSKKRKFRFGSASGLPDYMYLKISEALLLDNLLIEGIPHTIIDGEAIEASDDIDGHPMYYYSVNMDLKNNNRGVTFAGSVGADESGVILVIDGTAFGLPAGSLKNISVSND
jgi:hypothetical protein